MVCGVDKLFGYDVDYLLAYPTTKIVLIQDARLGLLKYLLMLGVLLYVAVYQLAKQGLYLESKHADGVSRFTLQPPTVKSCSLFDFSSNCTATFSPLSQTDYCSQSDADYAGVQYPCAFYDESDLGIFFDSSMMMGTRITEFHESRACSIAESPDTCALVWTLDTCDSLGSPAAPGCSPSPTYAASAEQFTVLFDHHLSVLEFGLDEESAEMQGMIHVSEKGDPLLCQRYDGRANRWGDGAKSKPPCFIAPNLTDTGLDFISVDVLLRSAGVTLDAIGSSGKTYRDSGASVIVNINYSNRRLWKSPLATPRYVYEVTVQENASYKYFRNVFNVNTTRRTVWNMHGLRINTIQSGDLKRFSFNNLLIQLTTSLTLLTVATVITDYCLLYVLPEREVYVRDKFALTQEYSTLRSNRAIQRRSAGDTSGDVGVLDSAAPGSRLSGGAADPAADGSLQALLLPDGAAVSGEGEFA